MKTNAYTIVQNNAGTECTCILDNFVCVLCPNCNRIHRLSSKGEMSVSYHGSSAFRIKAVPEFHGLCLCGYSGNFDTVDSRLSIVISMLRNLGYSVIDHSVDEHIEICMQGTLSNLPSIEGWYMKSDLISGTIIIYSADAEPERFIELDEWVHSLNAV